METLYTIGEVAKHFRVTERTVIKWISKGHLGAIKVSGTTRIRQSDIDAIFEATEEDK